MIKRKTKGVIVINEGVFAVGFFGAVALLCLLWFGFQVVQDNQKALAYHKVERIENKEYKVINEAIAMKYSTLYNSLHYVYSSEYQVVYGVSDDETKKARKKYLKMIESPDWNGQIPTQVKIQIKERWENKPSQRKQLFELSQLMKKNGVRASIIIYNTTNNISDTPSSWFTITDKAFLESGYLDEEYDFYKPLVFFEEIQTLKDIEKTNAIYSGSFDYDIFDDNEPYATQFDGNPL